LLPHQSQHLGNQATNPESLNSAAQPAKPGDTKKGPIHQRVPAAYGHLSMNQPNSSMQHTELKGTINEDVVGS